MANISSTLLDEAAGISSRSEAIRPSGARVPSIVADLDGGPAPAAEALSKDGDLPLKVLGARICALATRMAQATFHWLVMIAEFDRREGWGGVGIRSCAHWLAWTCSMATGTAREHVRVARALQELPLVSAQMAEGRLSYAKVREITRVADRVDEATLVDLARTSTASQLARTVQGFRRSNRDRASQEQRRGARWWTDDDGSVVLSVRLPAEEGAAVIAALQAARDDLTRHSGTETDADADDDAGGNADSDADPAADLSCGSERSDARGRQAVDPADVVLQWARGYLSASPEDRSGEDRTMVVVHVAAEHLLPEPVADADVVGTAERSRGNAPPDRTAVPTDCCQIPGVGGVSADTAARLACDAYIVGVIRGAGGVVLAHGRRRRSVSRAQRRLLTIRDGMCRYPSCTRVSHLEAHHVRHWMHGGTTDPDNLLLLCRFHHMACHEGGIAITYALDSRPGVPRWHFATREGEALLGDRLPSGSPGWKDDSWILWQGLDGSTGWNDPEAVRIRPRWAGERFSLKDAVGVLFGASVAGAADDPEPDLAAA